MYQHHQQRQSSQIQQQTQPTSNQFIAHKFRQQQQPPVAPSHLNASASSYSNPGTLKEIYETSQADQIRQQRIVTSRKTAAKRAQRILSASRNQNLTLSAHRNHQQLATQGDHQRQPLHSKFYEIQQQHQNKLRKDQQHLLASMSNSKPAIGTGIGDTNMNSAVQQQNSASPHVNPLLSQETSRTGSLRQSLAFTTSACNNNQQQHVMDSSSTTSPKFEVQNNRYSSCRLNSGAGTNSHQTMKDLTVVEDPLTANMLSIASATGASNTNTILNNENLSASFSLDNQLQKSGGLIQQQQQPLPPLSKQLIQRRSQLNQNAAGSSTANVCQSVTNLQKQSVVGEQQHHHHSFSNERLREGAAPGNVSLQFQSSSTSTLHHQNAQNAINLKHSLSQKRQTIGSRAPQQALMPANGPQINSLLTAHETIESVTSSHQQQHYTRSSRFLMNTNNSSTNYHEQSQPQINNSQQLQQQSLQNSAASHSSRVQRLPSFRKRRLEMNHNLNLHQQMIPAAPQGGIGAAHQTIDAPIMQQIKNRISLASAAVDSRRSSTKKIKCGSTSNSRKVTQNNFYTIPVKDNSTLPTPLDSNHKSNRQNEMESSCKLSSSKGFIVGNHQNSQEQFLTVNVNKQENVNVPGTAAAKSQRQLRYAGQLPSQRLQTIETLQNNSAASMQRRHYQQPTTSQQNQRHQQQSTPLLTEPNHQKRQRPIASTSSSTNNKHQEIVENNSLSTSEKFQQSSKTRVALPVAFLHQQRLRQTVASRENSLEKDEQQDQQQNRELIPTQNSNHQPWHNLNNGQQKQKQPSQQEIQAAQQQATTQNNQQYYVPVKRNSAVRQQEQAHKQQQSYHQQSNMKEIQISQATPLSQQTPCQNSQQFFPQPQQPVAASSALINNSSTHSNNSNNLVIVKTALQGLYSQSSMLNQLQQRSSGTRNTGSGGGLIAHQSHEQPAQRNVVEFAVRDRRADSRPRGGAGAGQRFQQMRQCIQQPVVYHHRTPGKNQPGGAGFINNSFAALETTSNEINESVRGIDHQQILNIQAQLSGSGQGILNSIAHNTRNFQMKWDFGGDAITSTVATGKETQAAKHQLINEMSYIQNASSNENLLSPNMFSNNSLSPSNPQYLEHQPSIINNSLEPLSPHEVNQNQTKYSSLERSLQRVGVQQDNQKCIYDSASRAPMTRSKLRRNFIRKMSGPASKLFPPGFFAAEKQNTSLDASKSPMKISLDSSSHQIQQQLLQPAMSIRSNPLHPNEIFPQMSQAQLKQNEALQKAKAMVCQQKKLSLRKPQLNVTLSPTRCALEINRNASLDDHHYSKQSTAAVGGQVKKSLGQFNKDRLSMPQQQPHLQQLQSQQKNGKTSKDAIILMDQKLETTQEVDHHLMLQFNTNNSGGNHHGKNEIQLRVQTGGDESKLSAQPSAEMINAISNCIDGLNVPLPPAVTQNILERNGSQNFANLPVVDHAPIQNQSKSHCPSKMGKVPLTRNDQFMQGAIADETLMSDCTNNTFSDRVQKINKKNNSNQRSTLASKEANRTAPQSASTKVQQSSQDAERATKGNQQACFNQNWVVQQQRQNNKQLNSKKSSNETSNQGSCLTSTAKPDTSIGILSQSTAAASSGIKIQNKNHAKLQQHLIKKTTANHQQLQQNYQQQYSHVVVKTKNVVEQGGITTTAAASVKKVPQQQTLNQDAKQHPQPMINVKFNKAHQQSSSCAQKVLNINSTNANSDRAVTINDSNNNNNSNYLKTKGAAGLNVNTSASCNGNNFKSLNAIATAKFTSGAHGSCSSKVVPQLPIQLIQSKASSPPDDQFTPYMNGVLSPNSDASSSLPVSPGRKNLMSLTRGDHDNSSNIKIVSFGQSRCDSSQMAPEQQLLLNNTIGGGPSQSASSTANQEGIMTFGNFATLLQEQQHHQQQSQQKQKPQQNLQQLSSRTLGQQYQPPSSRLNNNNNNNCGPGPNQSPSQSVTASRRMLIMQQGATTTTAQKGEQIF